MNTRSKRVRTNTLPQQRHQVVEPDEAEESEPAEVEAMSTARKLAVIEKKSALTSEEQPSSRALTPPQAPKRNIARMRTPKAVSPLPDSMDTEGTPSLKIAAEVSVFWYEECQKVFPLEDGYEIDVYPKDDTAKSQQVVVWESEFHDAALIQRPGSPLSEEQLELPLPEKAMRTEEDCDFSNNAIQPPETMKEYERLAKLKTRDVPIFVIECRGADGDNEYEWRNPTPQDISRSYEPPPPSRVQQALIDYIYKFDTKIKYEPKPGWFTQEQCFCATAVGDKVKFWKHVSPYPHLKSWSEVLHMGEDQETFRRVVDEKLVQVEDDGYEFAMEIYGRETFVE